MTNDALQILIGSWFPNPETDNASEVAEVLNSEEPSDEKKEPSEVINKSLLQFSEESSQFLNLSVPPNQLHSLMAQ